MAGGEAVSLSRSARSAPLWFTGGAAALAIAAGLAWGKRKDRQTQITGLDDQGVAALSRHQTSDFGSGWRGQEDSSTRPWLAGMASTGAGYYGYRRMLSAPGGPERLYRWAQNFGEYSPGHIFRTFELDAMASSYLPRALRYEPSQLYYDGKLTDAGEHLQRVLGRDLEPGKEYLFRRAEGDRSPFLTLDGTGERVRFDRGRTTSASFRLDRELGLDVARTCPGAVEGALARACPGVVRGHQENPDSGRLPRRRGSADRRRPECRLPAGLPRQPGCEVARRGAWHGRAHAEAAQRGRPRPAPRQLEQSRACALRGLRAALSTSC